MKRPDVRQPLPERGIPSASHPREPRETSREPSLSATLRAPSLGRKRPGVYGAEPMAAEPSNAATLRMPSVGRAQPSQPASPQREEATLPRAATLGSPARGPGPWDEPQFFKPSASSTERFDERPISRIKGTNRCRLRCFLEASGLVAGQPSFYEVSISRQTTAKAVFDAVAPHAHHVFKGEDEPLKAAASPPRGPPGFGAEHLEPRAKPPERIWLCLRCRPEGPLIPLMAEEVISQVIEEWSSVAGPGWPRIYIAHESSVPEF